MSDERILGLDPAIDPAIRRLVADYFEVIHAQDMQLFDRVFHKSCCLYTAQGGEVVLRPYALYREQVAGRKSPAELGNPRADRVLMFDQISDTLAIVHVQLQMFGGIMQDYLNIVFADGQWWVLAKMYEQVGEY
jgi:hypothetical protein